MCWLGEGTLYWPRMKILMSAANDMTFPCAEQVMPQQFFYLLGIGYVAARGDPPWTPSPLHWTPSPPLLKQNPGCPVRTLPLCIEVHEAAGKGRCTAHHLHVNEEGRGLRAEGRGIPRFALVCVFHVLC